MVITCAQCQTRFRVDEHHIPAEGVRVRCSQCQHRFFIEPSGLPAAAEAPLVTAAEDSSPAAGEMTPSPDDIDFENPEFLYDSQDEADSLAADSGGVEVESAWTDEDLPEVGCELDSESSLEPQIAAGSPGEELTQSGDPDFGAELDLEIPGFEGPAPGPEFAAASSDRDGLDPLLEPTTPEVAPDPGWVSDTGPPSAPQAPELPEAQAAKPVLEVSENDLLDWEEDLAEVDEKPEPAPRIQASAEAASTQAEMPSLALSRQPTAQGRLAGSFARTRPALAVAFALGLALAGVGGWRAVTFGSGPLPGPELVEAHGWVASGFEVLHWRSPLGAQFLVIRGDLYAVGPQSVPGVRVTLVGPEGQALGEPVWARIEQPQERGPSPETGRARTAPREFSREHSPAWAATGFSLWIADPPNSARRFRLDLVPAP